MSCGMKFHYTLFQSGIVDGPKPGDRIKTYNNKQQSGTNGFVQYSTLQRTTFECARTLNRGKTGVWTAYDVGHISCATMITATSDIIEHSGILGELVQQWVYKADHRKTVGQELPIDSC